jgi:hypothetical protein
LPKFKFIRTNVPEKVDAETGDSIRGGIMTQCDTNPPVEQLLQAEDAVCLLNTLLGYLVFYYLTFLPDTYRKWCPANVTQKPTAANSVVDPLRGKPRLIFQKQPSNY